MSLFPSRLREEYERHPRVYVFVGLLSAGIGIIIGYHVVAPALFG